MSNRLDAGWAQKSWLKPVWASLLEPKMPGKIYGKIPWYHGIFHGITGITSPSHHAFEVRRNWICQDEPNIDRSGLIRREAKRSGEPRDRTLWVAPQQPLLRLWKSQRRIAVIDTCQSLMSFLQSQPMKWVMWPLPASILKRPGWFANPPTKALLAKPNVLTDSNDSLPVAWQQDNFEGDWKSMPLSCLHLYTVGCGKGTTVLCFGAPHA